MIDRPALILLLGAVAMTAACRTQPTTEETTPEVADYQPAAERLARESILVDTHIDLPYRLQEEMEDISQRTEKGDFDHPRAVAGGLNAAFMSIYVPASYQETGGAPEVADHLIDMVEGFATQWPDEFAIARSPADVRQQFAQGLLSLPMGMENGAPIEDLEALRHFYQRGIRYITLTHSENNQICDSSYADEKTWNGLSPYGREVVAEMNRLGIMIDVSHTSDDTLFQVLEESRAPVIASHSSCRAFTPGWERNMSDDGIKALAAKGGVLQINFGSAFLTAAANAQLDAYREARGAFIEAQGLEEESPEVLAWQDAYWQQHPKQYADVSDVADHIDHVVELVGVDHVGLGSDFDGVGDSLPTGLKDVSQYPNLIRVLLERGYSEEDVGKIIGGNLLRVWEEVERVAASLQAVH